MPFDLYARPQTNDQGTGGTSGAAGTKKTAPEPNAMKVLYWYES